MTRMVFAVVMAAAAFCGTAVAQSAGAPLPPRHSPGLIDADTNGDGILSRMEFLAQAALRFDRMDINKDGALSADELRAGNRGRRGGAALSPGDPRGAGPAGPPAGRAEAAARGGARAADDGPGRGAAMFARLDANGDGKLARDEVQQMPGDRFDRLDTDHDGYLMPAELRAAAGRRGGLGQQRPGDDRAPPRPGDPEGAPQ